MIDHDEDLDKDKIEVEINNKKKQTEDNMRPCLETLLKIIDFGLDKSYDDLMQGITMLSQPITENFITMVKLRYFPKLQFYEKKKISILQYSYDDYILGNDKTDYLNLYENYKQAFTQVFYTYFNHLNENINSSFDAEKVFLLEKKRYNFYRDYRIKIALVEDQKVLSSFVDNLHNFYKRTIKEDKFDDDFNSIWNRFIKTKDEFEINYVLYLLPQISNYREIYSIPSMSKNEKITEDFQPLFSEFLSNNDHIYKNIVYLPWAIPREVELTDIVTKMNDSIGNGGGEFQGPTIDTLYAFLKQPLNLYLTDADHIFNLKLFKVTIEHGNYKKEKIFWKSIDIHLNSPKKTNDLKKKSDNNTVTTCGLSMHCVDLLGVHYKEKDKEKKVTSIQLNDPIQIKIFNIFFRKDAPFNYNMNSNNGWLELFAWDNFLAEVPKNFHKVINPNVKSNYFDDFVIPQFELDSTFKNYKATYIDICPTDPVVIKIDDLTEINSKAFRDSENWNEQLHIRIEKYERNDKHVSIPIATFMPI